MKGKPAQKSKPARVPPTPSNPTLGPQTTGEILVNFKPRPRLFIILGVVFALWVGALLWLYFKTVYPQRHTVNPVTLPA